MAKILGLKPNEIKKYDVYVIGKMEGNVSEMDLIDESNVGSMIMQLLDGLSQLEKAGKSHNDINPKNILYKFNEEFEVNLKISDFGRCDRSGGTPGWTPPIFQSKRIAGKSDMYSIALVILYILCDDAKIFYCLRDNYIESGNSVWLTKFQRWPEIELIMKMMSLSDQPTVEECKEKWTDILESEQFEMITEKRMDFIPESYKEYQYKTKKDKISNETNLNGYDENEFNWEDIDSVSYGELYIREK